jgi:nicotinamidase-related amidase
MTGTKNSRKKEGTFVGTLGVYVDDRDVHNPHSGNTGLLVVDMIYGSAHAEYGYLKMYRQMGLDSACSYYLDRLANKVIPNIKVLQEAFRRQGMPVIFTTFSSERDDYGDLLPRAHHQMEAWEKQGYEHPYTRIGEDGARILDDLAPIDRERIVNKTRISAFNGSNIDEVLRHLDLELLVLTGVGTNYCVQCTLQDAYDFGYECIVVEDATATLSEEIQRIAIQSMEAFAKVMRTADILDELKRAQSMRDH